MKYTYADAYNDEVGNRFYEQIDSIRQRLADYTPTESWWMESVGMYIAHEDEEVRGFCAFYRADKADGVAVWKLSVMESAEQTAIEKELLKHVISFAKQRGYPWVDVGAAVSSEEIPQLYASLGFEIEYVGLAMPI